MQLLRLLFQPKSSNEYILLILFYAAVFLIPAAIIHHKSVADFIKQRKWIVAVIVLLPLAGFALRIDTNVVKVYRFAEEYGWQVSDIYHEEKQLVLASDPYFEPALTFSQAVGLPTEQVLNEPIDIYRCSVSGKWSFVHNNKELTLHPYVVVGIHGGTVVYAVLCVDGMGYRYYPVNTGKKELEQEFVKGYEAALKGRYYIPFSDKVMQ